MKQKSFLAFGLIALLASNAYALDAANVPEKKRTTVGLYLSAQEANEFLKKSPNTLFVDIRTRAEVNFLGMPTVADANVPYAEMNTFWLWDEQKQSFKLESNAQFVAAIEKRLKDKGLDSNANIILMCRSGSRSAKAANLLAKQGYKSVYSVVDGYEGDTAKDGPHKGQRAVNGWRNAGLPWSYKLDKAKMSFE